MGPFRSLELGAWSLYDSESDGHDTAFPFVEGGLSLERQKDGYWLCSSSSKDKELAGQTTANFVFLAGRATERKRKCYEGERDWFSFGCSPNGPGSRQWKTWPLIIPYSSRSKKANSKTKRQKMTIKIWRFDFLEILGESSSK
jgi:hypothetical protein